MVRGEYGSGMMNGDPERDDDTAFRTYGLTGTATTNLCGWTCRASEQAQCSHTLPSIVGAHRCSSRCCGALEETQELRTPLLTFCETDRLVAIPQYLVRNTSSLKCGGWDSNPRRPTLERETPDVFPPCMNPLPSSLDENQTPMIEWWPHSNRR